MRQRSLVGLVVVAAMLFSAVAWGKLPDPGDLFGPTPKNPVIVPPVVWGVCGQSPFSQKVEDYMMTTRMDPATKEWQLAVYARLGSSVDATQLPIIWNNLMKTSDTTGLEEYWNFNFLTNPLEHFLGILPLYITFDTMPCDILPNKDGSTKGNWVRCTAQIPKASDAEAFKSNETSKYQIVDGLLGSDLKPCQRIPAALTFKQMAANAGADADGDGVPDGIDNCPNVANFSQDVDASGKPTACPEAAACDTATVCTADVCANNGFAATCDAATICTAEVCAGLNLSTGGDATADSGGGMCTLLPVGSANPAGLILLLSAVGLIAARRRG